jgi:hypothetical protein
MGRGRNGAGRNGRKPQRAIRLNPDTEYIPYGNSYAEYEFRVDGNRAKLEISPHFRGYGFHAVEFSVNGEFKLDENDPVDTGTGRTIVLRAIQAWRHYADRAPEGTKYIIHASSGDERANGRQVVEQRYRLYRNFGFSEPDVSGYQYAIKRKGKIVPYTPRSFEQ